MFKNVLAPIQAWLLSRGQCVGCGMPLAGAKSKTRKDKNIQLTCKCGRVFIRNPQKKTYTRALFSEIE
jgi:hypothetical protein